MLLKLIKKISLVILLSQNVDNIIQLGTAELYIDNPDDKSGLKSLKQYPIINATTYSYIFL